MAVEILSSRLLSPHFGNSVYVWGSIISVFLAALSLGYVAGGRLADRFPRFEALGQMILLAAVCLALLLLWGEPAADLLGQLTGGSPAGTLLAAAVLFAAPTIAFGMVSPWAVRLAASKLEQLGHLAGRLYAVSTFGSLAGTLGCTFLLIPFLTIKQALALLLGVTAVTAWVALGFGRRELRLPVALAALLVVFSGLHLTPEEVPAGLLYRRLTPYQTLEVGEVDGERLLVGDRAIQSLVRLSDGQPARSYPWLAPAALLFKPDAHHVVLLGMGSGNFARVLRKARPEVAVDYVEIDPAVADVAGRFFGFALTPLDRLHVADARRFLVDTPTRWDVVYADTYVGSSVPFHLATREFFALVETRLADDGVLAVNLAGGLSEPFSRAMVRTMVESFPTLYAFRAPRFGNVVIFATKKVQRLSKDVLRARAEALATAEPLDLKLTDMVDGMLLDLDVETMAAPLLLDEHAPVERLLHHGKKPAAWDLTP